MKTVSFSIAAFLLFGGVSLAADFQILPATAAAPASTSFDSFDWSGFHAGIVGGYVNSNTSTELESVNGPLLEADVVNGSLPGDFSNDAGGALFGVGAGYDWQFGSFVLGLEGDVAWANVTGSDEFRAIDPGTQFAPIFAGQETITGYTTELNGLATARVRAGVAADRALFYVTGGVAAGHVSNEYEIGVPGLGLGFGPWSDSGVLWGYSAGVGLEYAVTENVTAKLEYLHYDLSDRKVRATSAAFPGQQITYKFLNNGDLIRAGLNFKF